MLCNAVGVVVSDFSESVQSVLLEYVLIKLCACVCISITITT